MKIGDKVKLIDVFDLPVRDFEGIVRRIPSEQHRCAAVEIITPANYDGHDCDGATPKMNGWNCFVEELEVIE